jgi:histone-binding protein RBBP4
MAECTLDLSVEFNEEEEMIINQEYKIWKKEAPYYYDFLLLHSVDWPTFTFQWLPEFEVHDDYTSYFAIIASSSSEVDQSQLQKIRVDHPN